MPKTSIRLSDELYEQIQQQAETEGISISDFIRGSVENRLNGAGQNGGHPDGQAGDAPTLQLLREQFIEQRAQIQHLQSELSDSRRASEDASKRSDTIIAQMTQQLDRTHLQLEDLRQRRSFWQRIFHKDSPRRATA